MGFAGLLPDNRCNPAAASEVFPEAVGPVTTSKSYFEDFFTSIIPMISEGTTNYDKFIIILRL
jgi:hypothetical protein